MAGRPARERLVVPRPVVPARRTAVALPTRRPGETLSGMEQQDTDGGGRLALIDPADMDDDQRRLDERLRETTAAWASRAGFAAESADGRLIGPFNVLLHSPGIARGFGAYIAAEAEHTTLSPTLREVVILTVGTVWHAEYEVYAHVAVARSVGLREEVIDTIRADEDARGVMAEDEAVVHAFTRELAGLRRVAARTYARAVEVLGQRAVVDMVHLIGLYLTTSAILNAFAVPAPDIPPAP